ncbi:SusC/RagA family TonB-linked outer membrane protein [Leeuwenhoekiella parthenopeia]|uniref:SusC/RagA family TonB-linked outer membrane protein n=1 Tax=Leeuwenhoekiella parthenopeia TaxID=2890320 RepID=A0ABS8GUE1_9FLAO|nr:SusC/RagA family TonB-linked outer membrane protein [Leeuwenhoekiella parthenopeia]MCC4213629.1 SusC/RagA family TonB-linked outer membrane protein [Leeuwenhoekiella parthenopeia]
MKYLRTKIVLFALIALTSLNLTAQSEEQIVVEARILDASGEPVQGAIVQNKQEDVFAITDETGQFTISVNPGSFLQITAEGFKSISITADEYQEDIVLVKGSNSEVQIAFQKVEEGEIVAGGTSHINLPEILDKNYTTYSLDGLNAFIGGFNGGNIWGMGNYLVLVDGVPRSAGSALPVEIEQVTFLKGVTAAALYGSRAAQGVILITTKRGEIGKQQISARVDAGLFVPKRYPQYLGSAEYMTYYNEARANDGISALYSDEEIFNHASGSNPFRYPSVNFYSDEYLKPVYERYDATVEISGGNESARYYTDIGFFRTGNQIDFGEAVNNKTERFNVRGNVDLKLNDWISASLGANAIYYSGRGVNANYWGNAATVRPNRFSPLIPLSFISEGNETARILAQNSSNIIDGRFLLGGSQIDQTNAFASIYAGGYNTFTSREFQFNTSIDADLNRALKGLTLNTTFGVDYSTSYNQSYNNQYSVYGANWINVNGQDEIGSLIRYGEDARTGIQNISNSFYQQTISFSSQLNYETELAENHNLSAMLVAGGWQQTLSGQYHRISSANLGLQLAYNYKNRYYVLFNEAVVHSARFAKGQRTGYSPTATVAWKIGREPFLENSSIVNDLELSVSAGVLSTDLGFGANQYYAHETIYSQTEGAWFSWRDGALTRSTNSLQAGNPELTFARRKEINVELKGSLFNNSISFQTAFFANRMKGNIIQPGVLYPNYFQTGFPASSFVPYINYNNDDRIGFDFDITYSKTIGSIDWTVGLAGIYYDTKASQRAELFENEYQNREGKPIDAMFGLRSDGFFSSDDEVASAPNQDALGGRGTTAGDIRYIDQNGDGIINNEDEVYLGKWGWSGAPLSAGIHLSAKWKNLTFFALATGQTGAHAMKNGSYFWIDGEDKYSTVVRDRWTPETAATATYPRLTTQNGERNFRNSDFWMYSTDRIDLAKVQVSYDIPAGILGSDSFLKNLNIYVSGANLFTFSSERELMELNIGNAPQTRFYNLGLKALF